MARDDVCTVENCIARASIFDRDGGFCKAHWDERWAAMRAEEKRVTEEAGGPWPQTCPRRYEAFQRGGEEGQDTWDIREQLHHGLRARHCSYCGSLHPDDFMRLVKEGWQVGATDKNYKAYLGSPPDGVYPEGHPLAGQPRSSSQETKFYFQHLSDEQKQEFVDLYNERRIAFSGGGGFYRLPFFMVRAQ